MLACPHAAAQDPAYRQLRNDLDRNNPPEGLYYYGAWFINDSPFGTWAYAYRPRVWQVAIPSLPRPAERSRLRRHTRLHAGSCAHRRELGHHRIHRISLL